MNEKDERTTGTLSAMQPDLEYIPVCSDPRGIYLSEMYEEDPEPEETSDRDKQHPTLYMSLKHISDPTRHVTLYRIPSSA